MQNPYQEVLNSIEEVCHEVGRKKESVRLIVVSKAQPAHKIAELHKLGQKFFGENYAQELVEKAQNLPNSIEWIFIGHLQSNKIRRIVEVASEIQSVASLRHAQVIERCAQDFKKIPYSIFIEVNVGEEGKSGVPFEQLGSLASEIQEKCPQLRVEGVMAIPPARFAEHWDAEGEALYSKLRTVANGVGRGKLSLGMSGDFREAIRCGSDVVRVGSLIMGERK